MLHARSKLPKRRHTGTDNYAKIGSLQGHKMYPERTGLSLERLCPALRPGSSSVGEAGIGSANSGLRLGKREDSGTARSKRQVALYVQDDACIWGCNRCHSFSKSGQAAAPGGRLPLHSSAQKEGPSSRKLSAKSLSDLRNKC